MEIYNLHAKVVSIYANTCMWLPYCDIFHHSYLALIRPVILPHNSLCQNFNFYDKNETWFMIILLM